nr:glycosyltransferase 87 family protein [Sphingomonas quercus]
MSRDAGRLAAIAMTTLALAYLVVKSAFSHDDPSEFPMFWGVGRAMAEGISPYSPRTPLLIGTLLSIEDPAPWFYPPQWFVILRPIGLLPMDRAIEVWRAINALLLAIAAMALSRALPRAGIMLPEWAMALFLLFATFIQATPATLAMGQSSLLIFAGYCFYARGLILSERATLALGVFLLLLKPHFGVAAAMALVLVPGCGGALFIAVLATGAAALPQFVLHGFAPTIVDFIGNIRAYGGQAPNAPIYMNGLSQILSRFLHVGASGIVLLPLCVAASMGAALALRARVDGRGAIAFAVIALAMFFVPTHPYDIIAFAPLAILAMAFDWPVRAATWLSMAICLRPRLVWDFLSLPALRPGGDTTPQNIPLTALILTVACTLALIAAALVLLRPPVSGARAR